MTGVQRSGGPAWVKPLYVRRVAQAAVSGGCIALLLAVCLLAPHINDATVALLMVLCISGLAKIWGTTAALTAAAVGGIGFDYYFLPPAGFAIDTPEHGIALAAFLITAAGAGHLIAQSNRRRDEALGKQCELETLRRIGNALFDSSSPITQVSLTDKLAQILDAAGVALYDKRTGRAVRSHPGAWVISDEVLYEAAAGGCRIESPGGRIIAGPVHHNGELTGSIGIMGKRLSIPLFDALGAQVGLYLDNMHLIERTMAADIVRRSEELKSAALDAMAHEIRTPLNSVKLAASILLYLPDGISAEMRELITMINAEADRMDRCIDEAVRLSRTAIGELTLKKRERSVAQVIAMAVEGMGPRAVSRAVEVDIPESLPPVVCDRDMIVHVLRQLLNNALKYSPGDSSIAVTARLAEAAIVVSVIDGGPGVAEEERERIFEKHYRGRAARSGAPGDGLGLSSAKSIVEAHGGAIFVTSAPGGGAAFHVSLPATVVTAKSAG